jgi:molybdopterin-guanine dinucleotide biosynthesis protein A
MFKDISGVILAGGTSRRFGGLTKANIEVGGRTIISRILEVITPLFSEIIIVTNTPEEFPSLADHIIVGDKYPNTGPLGGIHAALCASSAKAVFVFAGDMPMIDKDIVTKQTNKYLETDCDILIPHINDYIEPLHSVYNCSLLPLLEKYLEGTNDFAVREFIKLTRVEYILFDPSENNLNAFSNINTPDDLIRINGIIGYY